MDGGVFVGLRPDYLRTRVPSRSQLEGAEEPQLVLRCDVWLEQQRGAQAVQDLGGEQGRP